jgi:hypothetical protein
MLWVMQDKELHATIVSAGAGTGIARARARIEFAAERMVAAFYSPRVELAVLVL